MKTAIRASLLVLSAAAGVLVGAGGYTVYTAEGTSYLSNDPRACINCHIMRDHFDGWQKASHHAVATCNDCHVPQEFLSKYWAKAKNGYYHSKGFTFQDLKEPIRIRPENRDILNRNCVRCHAEFVSEITFSPTGDPPNCVQCHTAVGHGPTR